MQLSKYTVFGNAGAAAGIASGITICFLEYINVPKLFAIILPPGFIVASFYSVLIGIAIKLLSKRISYSGIFGLTVISNIALHFSAFIAAVIYCSVSNLRFEFRPVGCMFSNGIAGIIGRIYFSSLFFFWKDIFNAKQIFKILPIVGESED